jgi:DNA polymerase III subunit gamma/tau
VERIWDLVGSVPEQDLLTLLGAIATGKPEHILETVRHLLDRGREPLIVLQSLSGFFRDLLIAKTAPHRQELVALTEPTWKALCQTAQTWELAHILQAQQHLRSCEGQIKNSTQPRLWLEVSILELLALALPSTSSTVTAIVASSVSPPPASVQLPSPALRPVAASVTNGQPAFSQPVQPSSSQTTKPTQQPISTADPPPSSPVATPALTASAIAEEHNPTERQSVDSEVIPEQPVEQNTPTLAESEEGDLTEIWQLLLEHLHRPSRALLKEHAQLTTFKGREAKIGIRNKNLAKIAQSKLPDVEEAFQKVFNRKVAVSLHILAPAAVKTPTPSRPSIPETAAPPEISLPLPPVHPAPIPSQNPLPPPAPPPGPSFPEDPVSFKINAPASLPAWETLDELTQASRSFAQFFNGAVVQTEGELELEVTDSTTLETAEVGEWDEP